ncbi:hypothetical protein Tco_0713059 [Tanacetum coccineum]
MKRISSRRSGGSVEGKVRDGGGTIRGNGGSGGSMAERGRGEVKGGGIDFRISKSLLGEILGVAIREGSGEPFGDDGIGKRLGVIELGMEALGSMRRSPSLRRFKGSRLRGLVRISAMLSSEETFLMEMFPFWTLSRRK